MSEVVQSWQDVPSRPPVLTANVRIDFTGSTSTHVWPVRRSERGTIHILQVPEEPPRGPPSSGPGFVVLTHQSGPKCSVVEKETRPLNMEASSIRSFLTAFGPAITLRDSRPAGALPLVGSIVPERRPITTRVCVCV